LDHKEQKIIEYLALLSVKHKVYLSELFQALVLARIHRKATCQNLKIEYRESTKKEAILLVTRDSRVVAQFRIPEEFLSRKNICFENWMDTDRIREQTRRQTRKPHGATLVQDLRHGMRRVDLEAEILEAPVGSLVRTRFGNSAMVVNAWIADETGKVKFCLWKKQASLLTEGDIIQIKNASVSTFKGERQLRLGRTGTITVLHSRTARTKQQSEIIA
jgi:hypothetical protein